MTYPSDVRPILAEQLARILEETAFMLVEEPNAPMPSPCPVVESQLAFSGAARGNCWLVVPEADAVNLAQEMLGSMTSDGPRADFADNAVGELLNILTAWVLDAWLGTSEPHSIGIPSTRRTALTSTKLWTLAEDHRVVVSTDSGATFMACVTED